MAAGESVEPLQAEKVNKKVQSSESQSTLWHQILSVTPSDSVTTPWLCDPRHSGGISGGATFFGVNREWRQAEWNERDSLLVKEESYTTMKTGQAWTRTRLKYSKTLREHWSCGGDLETWAQLGSAVMLSFENYLETDNNTCSSKVLHERRPHRVSYHVLLMHCWYGLMKQISGLRRI